VSAWFQMNVFFLGLGGGLSRLIGLWRAGELGEHADIHPIEVIFGSSDRAISAVDWLILLGHLYKE